MAEEGSKVADLFAKLGLVPDEKAWERGDALINGIKGALIGLGVVGGLNWAKGLVDQTVNAGDHAVKTAQKLGFTAETIQELGYAAEQSGSNLGTVEASLRRLSRRMESARDGSKNLRKAFREMGVQFKNSDGSLRPVDEVMMDIADHIAQLPDGAKKSAATFEVFGRSGTELIPMLNGGSKGIRELREEAQELGLVIDTETGKAMETFGDDQMRLAKNFTGIRNRIVTALLPSLQKLVTRVLDWTKANRKLIQKRLQQFIDGLVKGAQLLWRGIDALIRGFVWLRDKTTLLHAALYALAGLFVLVKVRALAAWVASIAPLLFLIAGITALYLIVEDLWVAFNGGESVFKNLYMAAKTWLADKFGAIIEYFEKKLEDAEKSLFGNSVREQRRLLREAQERQAITKIQLKAAKDREQALIDVTKAGQRSDAIRNTKLFTESVISMATAAQTDPLIQSSLSLAGPLPPQFDATINVTVPPGMDAAGIGISIKDAINEWWQGQMIDAADATAGGTP